MAVTHPTGREAGRPTTVPDDAAGGLLAPLTMLAEATAAEGLALTPVQFCQLAEYRDLLLTWNQRFNLTAITDPVAVERRLFLDALRLLPAFDDAIGGLPAPKVIDVGSGAGFPGMVLKIARPAASLTLLDATQKKVRFLEEVAAALSLTDTSALHGRAEEIGQDPQHRARYDVATARAVASLPTLLEYVVPLLRVGGVALLPKGPDLGGELDNGRRAATLLGAEITSADLLPGGETRLVVVRKRRDTPPRYPRRTGLPSQEPLGQRPGSASSVPSDVRGSRTETQGARTAEGRTRS